MSARPVRVAVIDSGINPANPHIGRVSGGVRIAPGGGADGDYIDRIGHGTAVAAAIRERAPRADLFAVRVFDRDLSASIDTLIAGIDWAGRQGVDLINLSLGTANPDHAGALRSAVDRVTAAGALLVAAGTSAGVQYLPGSLPGVVRVELEWSCPRLTVEVVADADGASWLCRASGYPRPVPGLPPAQNLKGLSFAVANVTGVLAREMRAGARPSVAAALELLRRAADTA